MRVGIIGGGVLGVTLGYYLAQQGVRVEILEAGSDLGGLASSVTLNDGVSVDRFYHTILSSDQHLLALCRELDLADRLRFNETRMGFYHQGRVHSMNNIIEFLRFPPLGWIDRFRLGLTVLYAQFVHDWQRLEDISVEDWLERLSGRRTLEAIWRPMLRAKFDGSFRDVPATYIWSRLVRMKSTRNGASQKEQAGYLLGGYVTLLKAMARRIESAGGRIRLNSPVQAITQQDGRVTGVSLPQGEEAFDAVAATVQLPVLRRLLGNIAPDYGRLLGQTDYLGIICPLLVLDRPLSGYWTLNITDDRVPFTGIIETTSYIDPQTVGGHHLVYLPKYVAPNSPWSQMSDQEIREAWLQHLKTMFPQFNPAWVRQFLVHRETYVEPIHRLHSAGLIPALETPLRGLYLATTAQIYPALTNVESVTRYALEAARTILARTEVMCLGEPESAEAPVWSLPSQQPAGAAAPVSGMGLKPEVGPH